MSVAFAECHAGIVRPSLNPRLNHKDTQTRCDTHLQQLGSELKPLPVVDDVSDGVRHVGHEDLDDLSHLEQVAAEKVTGARGGGQFVRRRDRVARGCSTSNRMDPCRDTAGQIRLRHPFATLRATLPGRGAMCRCGTRGHRDVAGRGERPANVTKDDRRTEAVRSLPRQSSARLLFGIFGGKV